MYGDYKTDISFVVAKKHCYGSQLILEHFGKVIIDHLHSLLWHSETEWYNAVYMHD